jgi:RNA polymerase sigma factor (sigma-70 family)
LFNIINSTIGQYIRDKTGYRLKTPKPKIISIESTHNFGLFINNIACPKNDSEINSIDNSDFYLLFNCLSERQKEVIKLYYFEELTFNEIGKVLGLHESTVYSYNVKALLKLKNSMESEYYAQYSIS